MSSSPSFALQQLDERGEALVAGALLDANLVDERRLAPGCGDRSHGITVATLPARICANFVPIQ